MKKNEIILPSGSGDYMLQERGIPINTSLIQQRDLNLQIYLFMQHEGITLTAATKYIPMVKSMCKRKLFDDFSKKFYDDEDIQFLYGGDAKKIGKVKYDTFCTRLQELDEKWGLVLKKHGDVDKYKDIDYYLIIIDGFNGYNYIPNDTTETLINGTNDFVVKVYDRLLSWYKISLKNGTNWTFTYKSLLESLGYSSTTSQNSKVKAALDILGGLGLIEVEIGGRVFINNKSVAVMELTYVGVEIRRKWLTFREPMSRKF